MSPAAGRRQPTEDTGRVRIPADVGIIHIDVIETKFPAHPGLTMPVHVPARASDQDKFARLV